MFGIFNYQKSSSSVVSSTLYALRTSEKAREILGDEVYFAHRIPWISGTMDQLHGRIDISYWVKGTKSKGKMRFRSIRPDRTSYVSEYTAHSMDFDSQKDEHMLTGLRQFRTESWTLETEDGEVIQLLETDQDPFNLSD